MFRRFTQQARNAVFMPKRSSPADHPAIGTEHILLGSFERRRRSGAWALLSLV